MMDQKKKSPPSLVLNSGTPPTQTNLDDASNHSVALISRAMAELSQAERDEALGDVHGIAREVVENLDLVLTSLSGMEEALRRLDPKSTEALTKARELSQEHSNSEEVKLKFLRSTDFQHQLAAHRLAGFFTLKMELFGEDKLVHDINLSDLDDTDIRCINSRCFRLLKEKDQGGRTVIWRGLDDEDDQLNVSSIQNQLKALWYVIMTALEDINVQKRGAIFVHFNRGSKPTANLDALWQTFRLLRCLPIRILAIHYCHRNIGVHQHLINGTVMALDAKLRARFRAHNGDDDKCLTALRAYGIVQNQFFEDSENFRTLRAQEDPTGKQDRKNDCSGETAAGNNLSSSNSSTDIAKKSSAPVTDLLPDDVLFGRGKAIQLHPGNRYCRGLVESSSAAYEHANRQQKTDLASRILCKVKQGGGRFLKQEEDGWYEVDDETARTKISHSFRSQRAQSKIEKKAPPPSISLPTVMSTPADLREIERDDHMNPGASHQNFGEPQSSKKRKNQPP